MARSKSGQALWTEVDRYFTDLLAPSDELLDAAVKANQATPDCRQLMFLRCRENFSTFLCR